MTNSSTSTAPDNQIPCAVTRKRSSTTGLSSASLNLLIRCIDNVLSALNNQGLGSKVIDSRTELTDLVQPVAADFSKFFDGISEGAKMFTDRKFSKSQLSTEAHSMAVDVLKGLGKVHWVAVGLLAIANVLERFDNISANDRECIDLLIAMLKLGKYLKQMKDISSDLHKEILEEMREAVKLIVSGAILCCSFITSNKLSKFVLTKKIRDDLVYVRGKVDSMKADLMLQMQVLTFTTLTFYHEQNNVAELGGHEENICLGATEQDPSDQSKDTESDNEESCEKELEGSVSDTNSSQAQDKNNGVNKFEQLEMPPRSSLGLGKYLRKKIPNIFKRRSQRPELLVEDISDTSDFSEFQNMEIQDMEIQDMEIQIEEIQKYKSLINFKRDELVKATTSFTLKIGSGAFGTVYHGILSDGREVAVKILRIEARQGETEWMNDLQILTKLRHRNIVELVGYCHEDMMLVYDYFPLNLSSAIFDKNEIFLDWSIRQRIILDIIRGLAYLHESAHVSIVHRGIKPNNILLDENWKAKICDFGLARIMQPDDAQYANKGISADCNLFLKDLNKHPGYVTSGPPGTIGYLDPEYDFTGCLNAKSDIYSFGLTLLNVVSGKGAVEIKNAEAWRLYKEDRLHELIDPRLLITDTLNSSSTLRAVKRAVKIALWCTQKEPERRPLASQVLTMLLSKEYIRIPLQGIESYLDFCPSHKTMLRSECLESSHAFVPNAENFATDMSSGPSSDDETDDNGYPGSYFDSLDVMPPTQHWYIRHTMPCTTMGPG